MERENPQRSCYKKWLSQTVTLQQRLGQEGLLNRYVHVALAFLPPPPTPMGRGSSVVDHKDENKLNNCVSNLHWISVKENICKHPYRKFQPDSKDG